jgi:hypothetical protein
VIGNLVSSSGFEDIVYQASVCTSGSLMGAMKGSHYNRARRIHTTMSEALERLLLKRYLLEQKPDIPESIQHAALISPDTIDDATVNSCKMMWERYDSYKEKVRGGLLGKTAQFWMIYLDAMKMQHRAHTAVQENDYDLRLESMKSFLPFYFCYNMHNYARYVSYYAEMLDCIDGIYPGLRSMLSTASMSVQAQDRYPVRTAIDQRGEQTINRDAKTSGGVTQFVSTSSSVLKWCLNR